MFERLAALVLAALPANAFACVTAASIELTDIFAADAVIVGRVINYEIIEVGSGGSLPDYARFRVRVQKSLTGDVSKWMERDFITFTWDNSTFGESDSFNRSEAFLFALRDPTSANLPLRAGSATILSSKEEDLLTVLQAPCAGAFIFGANSPTGVMLQQVLETDRDRLEELEILKEFLFERGAFHAMERELHLLRLGLERP